MRRTARLCACSGLALAAALVTARGASAQAEASGAAPPGSPSRTGPADVTNPPSAPSAPSAAAPPAGATAGEVVVTAQRRAEVARDVPIAITAISKSELAQADIKQLGDISKVTPDLRFDFTGAFAQPTIRGVGTAITTSGAGPNVGIYIDGFYSPNPLAADFDLLNVENIQVLKGPQGTLFGRNTTGGAILVTTAKPSFTPTLTAEASYGSYNAEKAQFYASTGVTDKLAVDLEGLYRRGDGFVTDTYTNNDKVGGYDNWSMRFGARYDLTKNIQFLFRYTHQQTDDPTNYLTNVYNNRTIATLIPGIPASFATGNPDQITSDKPLVFHSKGDIVQFTSTIDLNFATLTSYTQYRKELSLSLEDLDATAAPLFYIAIPVFDTTVSQEFLLSSHPGSKLQWTTGFFYFNYTDLFNGTESSAGAAPLAQFARSGTDTRSIAGFADLTYELFHNLFLTAGARYSHDTVSDAFFHNTGFAQVDVPPLTTDSATPRFVIRYKPSEHSSVYASYSRGFKAGLLNVGGGTLTDIQVQPERITDYEVGFKFGKGPLSFDTALFDYDYKDLQVASFNGTQSLINNAGSARISGAEVNATYQFGPHFSINGGASTIHAKYKNYTDSEAYLLCLNPTSCGANLGTYAITPINADGFDMQRAPQFSANLGARYTFDLFEGHAAFSGNAYYTAKFYFDSSDQFVQPGYALLNLRAEWTDPSGRYTLAVFGDNVGDARYRTQVLANQISTGQVWAYPATVGGSVRVHF